MISSAMLIDRIAGSADVSPDITRCFLHALFRRVAVTIDRGDAVFFPGIGIWYPSIRSDRPPVRFEADPDIRKPQAQAAPFSAQEVSGAGHGSPRPAVTGRHPAPTPAEAMQTPAAAANPQDTPVVDPHALVQRVLDEMGISRTDRASASGVLEGIDADAIAHAVREQILARERTDASSGPSPHAGPPFAMRDMTNPATDAVDEQPRIGDPVDAQQQFDLNRDRLLHPPVTRRSHGALHAVAVMVTVALICVLLATAWIGGLLNPVLPRALQYRRPSVQERLRVHPGISQRQALTGTSNPGARPDAPIVDGARSGEPRIERGCGAGHLPDSMSLDPRHTSPSIPIHDSWSSS